MTDALGLRGGEKVLEVGTGSGYQAAILAEMGCDVHTIEREPELASGAAERLRRLGYHRVRVHEGDGTLGLPDEAPFQGIVVTAGGPRVPEALKEQLDPRGGVLVIPVGDRTFQELIRVVRKGGRFIEENLGGCRFVPLVERRVGEMRRALLVIDMLVDFVERDGGAPSPGRREDPSPCGGRGRGRAEAGDPVVYLCDAHAPDDAEFSRMGWPAHA